MSLQMLICICLTFVVFTIMRVNALRNGRIDTFPLSADIMLLALSFIISALLTASGFAIWEVINISPFNILATTFILVFLLIRYLTNKYLDKNILEPSNHNKRTTYEITLSVWWFKIRINTWLSTEGTKILSVNGQLITRTNNFVFILFISIIWKYTKCAKHRFTAIRGLFLIFN